MHCNCFERRPSLRLGVTVIEILVITSVIGLIAALLFPAIQQTRSASRKIQCSNNLKQLGLAAQLFQESRGHFPIRHTFHRELLPFMEQAALGESIDEYIHEYLANGSHDFNFPVGRGNVSTFACPGDFVSTTEYKVSYLVNHGTLPENTSLRNGMGGRFGNGVFFPGRRPEVTVVDVRDGLSNTALISEIIQPLPLREMPGSRKPYFRKVSRRPQSSHEYAELSATAAQTPITRFSTNFAKIAFSAAYTHIGLPNSTAARYPDSQLIGNLPPSSQHAGGIQLLTVDGAVRFVSDTIDYPVWHALGTRNGRD